MERPALPWAKPRFEIALLVLVAVAALLPVYPGNTQDVSRLCLAREVLQGHLTIEPCASKTLDHAIYNGREYSDKAPGLSFIALPIVWAVGLHGPPGMGHSEKSEAKLWTIRLVASGLAFLALAFLIGRVSEGIAPGYGAAALVAFALGTYVCPLAATTFDHVLAGAFVFGGFLLAWSRRYLLAGLAVALAVDTNYLCGLLAIVIAAYVLSAGWRPLLRFALGSIVPLALLGAYDWAAFGSPFHLSYRYVSNRYSESQSGGFFGIGVPNAHAVEQVFVGSRGILVASPVIVAAVVGLFLLGRRYRGEAIVCGVAFGLLVLANCGYFLPYGGTHVGPRFLVPSLPFVALGLAPAFARWFRTTAVLAAVSILSMATLTDRPETDDLGVRPDPRRREAPLGKRSVRDQRPALGLGRPPRIGPACLPRLRSRVRSRDLRRSLGSSRALANSAVGAHEHGPSLGINPFTPYGYGHPSATDSPCEKRPRVSKSVDTKGHFASSAAKKNPSNVVAPAVPGSRSSMMRTTSPMNALRGRFVLTMRSGAICRGRSSRSERR